MFYADQIKLSKYSNIADIIFKEKSFRFSVSLVNLLRIARYKYMT